LALLQETASAIALRRCPVVVVLATAWGSKFGGPNAFSTQLCRALGRILTEHVLVCVCNSATDADFEDAAQFGISLVALERHSPPPGTPDADFVLQCVRTVALGEIAWWVGHDVITGPRALECMANSNRSQCAVIMHTSYEDYAYVKHPPEQAETIRTRTEAQRDALRSATVGLSVGPLLHNRIKSIRPKGSTSVMLTPGLGEAREDIAPSDTLCAISLGRFDSSEVLVKQAPLVVAGFARAFRLGHESNPVMTNAKLRLVGTPNEIAVKLRSLANEEAGRLVNLEAHEFTTDEGRLSRMLQESNVCMMLSWHEGFGLSGWEAIGAGVPLVVSKNSGLFQLLESIGGLGIGSVYPIDVRGQGDGEPHEDDVEAVKSTLLKLAANLPRAQENARALRKHLRFACHCTWTRTARELAAGLGLAVTSTVLDSLGMGAGAGDSQNPADLNVAQRVLTVADSKYQAGEYEQALEAIGTLKQYQCTTTNPEFALDAGIKEAQVYLRLNRYFLAVSLVDAVAREAKDRSLWAHYVRAREIETVVLRDRGDYVRATALTRELLTIAQNKCPSLVESVTRALARSLALSGLCDEAVTWGTKALDSAKQRSDLIAQAKASLALGEAHRHGRSDPTAIKWYESARDLSGKAGHTDCFLWSVLGLSDSLFLKGEIGVAKTALARFSGFVKNPKHIHPLETLHLRLSDLAIALVEGNPLDQQVDALLDEYALLGIQWPREYLASLQATPRVLVPKRF
jgi:glycosyltransferase involved in cell wall biosynthesis